MAKARPRVVVDGSNLATEGRSLPSLAQLDDALAAFIDENPQAEIIVVTDASFSHRVSVNERSRFHELELAGRIVTPPAGAIGRGDAFILKIADRIGAIVLSNDSFQEFHDEYPWLFEPGRLIGGKPVPTVGWIFAPRLPVRAARRSRAAKAAPAVKEIPAAKSPGRVIKKALAKLAAEATGASVEDARASTPAKATKRPTKATKKLATQAEGAAVKKSAAKKATKATKGAKAAKEAAKELAKALPKEPRRAARASKTAPAEVLDAESVEAATPALRRGRQPVNPEDVFARFRAAHRVGTRIEGEVGTFTSHGAIIRVQSKAGDVVECYAPTALLGTPAPARARDVLKRGERRTFRLVTVDDERRIAELSLP